jgi:hypothetical protein
MADTEVETEKKDVLGTQEMPYDPDNPAHKAIIDAYKVIEAAKDEIDKDKPTDVILLDAIKELTKQVGEMAKELKEMKERHDKWVKAGKF